jgi:hypothetical protein
VTAAGTLLFALSGVAAADTICVPGQSVCATVDVSKLAPTVRGLLPNVPTLPL